MGQRHPLGVPGGDQERRAVDDRRRCGLTKRRECQHRPATQGADRLDDVRSRREERREGELTTLVEQLTDATRKFVLADELAGLLKAAGFKDDNPADYTRYGSARELYHFKVDNTSAY